MKLRCLAIGLILMSAVLAHAGGATCDTATSVVPDGRLLQFDNVQPSSSNWYKFTVAANRSYSVEVQDAMDPDNTDLTVTYLGLPSASCSNVGPTGQATNATLTDTHATEPALPASASRVSIVTSVNGSGNIWVKVQNTSTTGSHYVNVGVTETTIYGNEWDTYGNLTTQFYFQNTTSQPITYTFTMVAVAGVSNGSPNSTTTGTLSPVSTPSTACLPNTASSSCASPNITTMGVTPGTVGHSILTHNGPPGAIEAFQFWACYSCTPVVIVPVPMTTLRGK
jgi:hypothetical protein